jgi:hypothetical protein
MARRQAMVGTTAMSTTATLTVLTERRSDRLALV